MLKNRTPQKTDNSEILKPPPYIDIRGMDKFFSIKRDKARELIATGVVSATKNGKQWLVLSSSVFEYLKSRRSSIPKVEEVSI